MVAKRIIPCLDVKAGRTVKGVNFVGLQDVGVIFGPEGDLIVPGGVKGFGNDKLRHAPGKACRSPLCRNFFLPQMR